MRGLFLLSSDSYTRAGRRLASLLRAKGVHCAMRPLRASFAARHPCTSDEPGRNLDQLLTPGDLEEFDLVVMGVAPRFLGALMGRAFAARRCSGRRARALICTYFPGIVQEKYYEALLNRASVDLLLCNSQRDLDSYRRIADEFQFSADNAFVLGDLGGGSEAPAPGGSDAVFVHQSIVPPRLRDRVRLAWSLSSFSKRWPGELRFVIRGRGDRDGMLQALRLMKAANADARVSFTRDLDAALDRAAVVLAVSSSVLLSAMARGIPAVAVADLGIRDDYGNAFYVGSGCVRRLETVVPGALPVPREDWFSYNRACPEKRLPQLLARLSDDVPGNEREQLLKLKVAREPGSTRVSWRRLGEAAIRKIRT